MSSPSADVEQLTFDYSKFNETKADQLPLNEKFWIKDRFSLELQWTSALVTFKIEWLSFNRQSIWRIFEYKFSDSKLEN